MNTSNLNFFLSSSKTQVQQFKRDVSNSATQDSIMNGHRRLNLLMQGSIVYSKSQVVTHHYQKISSSIYFLHMEVQAQQRYSNALTQKNYSIITHKDQKGLFKACNGAEWKGMVIKAQ
ncbi:hypothetical protein H5410_061249 [Solanum commersonii]|uniref:Uncharacterized protein n=1 Tax=Solanum commersonii TaxID=4109 RepID=A0A9J5W769_SOLCO|nr:hypothetical protein H5410_061249 [Solanum commersonii]